MKISELFEEENEIDWNRIFHDAPAPQGSEEYKHQIYRDDTYELWYFTTPIKEKIMDISALHSKPEEQNELANKIETLSQQKLRRYPGIETFVAFKHGVSYFAARETEGEDCFVVKNWKITHVDRYILTDMEDIIDGLDSGPRHEYPQLIEKYINAIEDAIN